MLEMGLKLQAKIFFLAGIRSPLLIKTILSDLGQGIGGWEGILLIANWLFGDEKVAGAIFNKSLFFKVRLSVLVGRWKIACQSVHGSLHSQRPFKGVLP